MIIVNENKKKDIATTLRDFARLLNVSTNTVWYYIKNGLPVHKSPVEEIGEKRSKIKWIPIVKAIAWLEDNNYLKERMRQIKADIIFMLTNMHLIHKIDISKMSKEHKAFIHIADKAYEIPEAEHERKK